MAFRKTTLSVVPFMNGALQPPQASPSIHLDALRGFAAFSVLLSHWRDAFFLDYSELGHYCPLLSAFYFLTSLGHQWVIVFFVMSGYLVGGSVLRSVNSGRWSWRSYLFTRFLRLYVVLLPALLPGGAIDWAGMHIAGTDFVYNGQSGMHEVASNVNSTLTLPTLAANAVFLQTISLPGMAGKRISTFGTNGPLWSLSNEFWFNLATNSNPSAGMAAMMPRAACALGLLIWVWFVRADIAVLGIPWLMGAAIAYLPSFPSSRQWARGLAIAAAVALLWCGLAVGRWRCTLTTSLLLSLTVVFFIWVTLHCAKSPLPPLYVKVAQRSARSSYTLYLVHLPALCFLKATLQLPRTAPNWQMAMVSLGVLAGILVYAQLFYELFEKNTDKIRNWIKPYVMGGGNPRGLPINPFPATPIVVTQKGTLVSSVFP